MRYVLEICAIKDDVLADFFQRHAIFLGVGVFLGLERLLWLYQGLPNTRIQGVMRWLGAASD